MLRKSSVVPRAFKRLQSHLYSMLLSDVRHRWEKLSLKESYFSTGLDEHGLKIQNAAELKGLPPKEFVDQLSVTFKDLTKLAHIDYDRFIRTTDDDHIQAVQHFWNVLNERGYIYEGEHGGWYSVSDETFYPEAQIFEKEGKYFSKETGTEVTYSTEKNYFFKLSNFKDQLIKLLKENPKWIIPEQKHKDVLYELETNGLQDLSISRPSSRLQWGIPVPGDESQTIYVWVDALVNYITCAKYPNLTNIWPGTHLIGKDIIRFHCVYWPSLLLAAGVALPKQFIVHGHWLADGYKMSKSRGNVVDPILMAQYYDTDVLRFFLCENSVLNSDNNFSEDRLFSTREQIVDKFGNLVMRCCGPKFDAERAIRNFEDHDVSILDESFQTAQRELVQDINLLHEKMNSKMIEFNTSSAIQDIWNVLIKANQFFQNTEPWKRTDQEKDIILFTALETARVSAILSLPFMPDLAKKFLNRIGVDKFDFEYAKYGADLTYGKGINRKGDFPIKKIEMRKSD
ncbi:hypothetical protein BN7_1189 [Wickerhamomyces ciferrii]|uniref:Probable methionine--tRNA ligase, mitochondrial n=1 Tax=Wickerhamomyces ciferrii (strain ATCC 14091 / BCRC 22168 / CBS 111 / JCM 3599 / NBRC 0793 / NRRL Y-1031 F-60-10) TaxID=1206466 RepID=K0KKK5_WICCF|nr:uncharacterized protein BN7_1189 [Wickerhamomyces ciferrii]CCH41648.1 hypothetical protein BN7_1189 [Wickerhamomyces ciferrii]